MPSTRTQTGLSLKSTAEKSHKLLSNLKEAVRSTFSKSSEDKEWEKGRERHKYKLREHPDIKSAQDEEDWAYVYQEVLADCVPDNSPNSYRADKGISVDDLRTIADEDQLFAGSRPSTRDGREAASPWDQHRAGRRRRYNGNELEAATYGYQRRAESRCYSTDDRDEPSHEDQFRAESRRFVN
ncbi:hypothetical protein FSPOR_1704 [Fusarium sporotrichioides]|uniref:Uncharacterized protein n=1 Tax=Fusarium sporotrichioides TaxID=5514 RepID=A0A395SNG3_FUSSP|nr:hypothetical protein FSPOR_1704 [Fusarium sporotrichioides]